MAAPSKKKHKEEKQTGSVIALVIILFIVLALLILALRQGIEIEEIDNPSLATIDTCGGFCRGRCISSLYDKMRAELFMEMNSTYCVCTCNSTLHAWVARD